MEQFEIEDLSVAAVFQSYPKPLRNKLLALRQLIYEAADSMEGVNIAETLKWGEPSYSAIGKIGTPIRLAPTKEPDHFGLFVHCQTKLIDEFRSIHPNAFHYSGTRALLFGPEDKPSKKDLRKFIEAALTYHQRKSLAPKPG